MKTKNLKKALLASVVLSLGSVSQGAAAFEFGAFGDVSLNSSDSQGESTGFAIGGIDLYTSQKISDNTSTFFEIVFENDGSGFVLDVERYSIKREFTPAFSLAAGRFHAPLGYWNRNNHHGVLLQDTASRPSFIDFEDGESAILPMHTIGLMAEGKLGRGFSYEAALGNSNTFDTSNYTPGPGNNCGCEIGLANVADASDGKTLIGRLKYDVGRIPLQVSIFSMKNAIVEGADTGGLVPFGNQLFSQTLYGFDLFYDDDVFSAQSEYYRLENDAAASVGDGRSHSADAYYIQLGWRFAEVVKATYRYESLSFDSASTDQDAYFAILGREESVHHVAALRYELDDSNALVFEFNRTDPAGSADSTNSYTIDWAFMLL